MTQRTIAPEERLPLLQTIPLSLQHLFAMFGSTVLAYVWYFEGIRVLGAGTAAGYLTFEPVFGVLFAALGLHEALHWSLVAGGSVAFAGMVLMYLGRRALTTGRGRSAASPRQ